MLFFQPRHVKGNGHGRADSGQHFGACYGSPAEAHCGWGRAHATHDAVLEQLRGMLLDAEHGNGWRVERDLENPGAPEHPRT